MKSDAGSSKTFTEGRVRLKADPTSPLDYVGSDGGGGVGGGPGISVGAALALKGSGRMAVAVCGDGDFMMGNTAVWTAVHYRIPILFVVANNRSFYNDEVHQERVAVAQVHDQRG